MVYLPTRSILCGEGYSQHNKPRGRVSKPDHPGLVVKEGFLEEGISQLMTSTCQSDERVGRVFQGEEKPNQGLGPGQVGETPDGTGHEVVFAEQGHCLHQSLCLFAGAWGLANRDVALSPPTPGASINPKVCKLNSQRVNILGFAGLSRNCST